MDVFAHGIFPLASRSFNHSCIPSAVPVYTVKSELVTMDIKLLHNLIPGEEVRHPCNFHSSAPNIYNLLFFVKFKITNPYTDPALPHATRQHDLNITYNFTCCCPLCQRPWLTTPNPAVLPSELANLEVRLREDVLPYLLDDDAARVESAKLHEDFFLAFHPSYLPSLAEAFSNASHDGPYDMAVQKGVTL